MPRAFWGLVSRELDEAIEIYATRAEAEQAFVEVVANEPTWEHLLFITPIELAGPEHHASPN